MVLSGNRENALDRLRMGMVISPRDHRFKLMVEDETWVICPHCLQRQMLYVDPSTEGEMVQDCDVCCHPWTVNVVRDDEGQPTVTIARI